VTLTRIIGTLPGFRPTEETADSRGQLAATTFTVGTADVLHQSSEQKLLGDSSPLPSVGPVGLIIACSRQVFGR
jgi:hypothetical protein